MRLRRLKTRLGNFQGLRTLRPRWFVGGLFGVCGACLLFLLRFFCCLSFGHNKLGLRLIFCVFCCFFLSLLHNSWCLFATATFAHNWKTFYFYRLGEFLGIVGSCLLLLGCMHDLYGAWTMFCVLVSRFADFLTKCVRTWCAGKFPGHPGPQIMHAYAPPCPSYLVLSSLYTSAPIRIIRTHLHPSAFIYILII